MAGNYSIGERRAMIALLIVLLTVIAIVMAHSGVFYDRPEIKPLAADTTAIKLDTVRPTQKEKKPRKSSTKSKSTKTPAPTRDPLGDPVN